MSVSENWRASRDHEKSKNGTTLFLVLGKSEGEIAANVKTRVCGSTSTTPAQGPSLWVVAPHERRRILMFEIADRTPSRDSPKLFALSGRPGIWLTALLHPGLASDRSTNWIESKGRCSLTFLARRCRSGFNIKTADQPQKGAPRLSSPWSRDLLVHWSGR